MPMPVNIGIVTEYYYPVLGGISKTVHHVASELVARGHRVTIVSGAPKVDGTASLAVPNGIPTVRIGRSMRVYGNGAIAHVAVVTHLVRDLRETLTAGRFDILQLHSPLFFTLPPLAVLPSHRPFVRTIHSPFELVRRRRDNVRLVIVGYGPLEPMYRRQVPDHLRDDVHFEGAAVLERPSYYTTADVFCSPVVNASFGITLLEAMACGTPIVATDNVGYRDLLGPGEGVLVPQDVSLFADAILDLLGDEQRRLAAAAAGRQKALRYA